MSVDPDTFRAAMRRVAQPVTVVTVRDESGLHGMTASSFTSIALDPPLILISVGESNATSSRIESVGTFAVNVLGAGQHAIGAEFARPGIEKSLAFDHLPHHIAATGSPILDDCICWFDCSVYATYTAGSCVLFIGHVKAAGQGTEEMPLLYRNRMYEPHNPRGNGGGSAP